MERYDEGMPFLLKYENVAWYQDGTVRILDRRVYPREIIFVECKSYKDVVKAIQDMVTQSAGPYTALGMGMALACYESRSLDKKERKKFIEKASIELGNARITTKERYSKITTRCYKLAVDAIDNDKDPVKLIMEDNIKSINRRYKTMIEVGKNLIDLIPENSSILTQCYGETIIGALISLLKKSNKKIKIYCAETRPFLQGARLTASCFSEEGFDTTILTDNMIAYAMENKLIDIFTSAADCITEDGGVVNKIGTLQIAQLAKLYDVKYFVTGIPDKGIKKLDDVKIEMKDPEEVLICNGIKYAGNKVKAIYPSFDKTPSNLVDKIVTDVGAYNPKDLCKYFENKGEINFY